MITFETQEDFEDAVMQVLYKRLIVEVNTPSGYGWGRVNVTLLDSTRLNISSYIASGEDSFDITTS